MRTCARTLARAHIKAFGYYQEDAARNSTEELQRRSEAYAAVEQEISDAVDAAAAEKSYSSSSASSTAEGKRSVQTVLYFETTETCILAQLFESSSTLNPRGKRAYPDNPALVCNGRALLYEDAPFLSVSCSSCSSSRSE